MSMSPVQVQICKTKTRGSLEGVWRTDGI